MDASKQSVYFVSPPDFCQFYKACLFVWPDEINARQYRCTPVTVLVLYLAICDLSRIGSPLPAFVIKLNLINPAYSTVTLFFRKRSRLGPTKSHFQNPFC